MNLLATNVYAYVTQTPRGSVVVLGHRDGELLFSDEMPAEDARALAVKINTNTIDSQARRILHARD